MSAGAEKLASLTVKCLCLVALAAILGRYGLFGPAVSPAAAEGTLGSASNNVIALTGRVNDGRDALYVVDTLNQTILVYSYDRAGTRRIEFLGARSFEWDRKIKRFNDGGPSLEEVRDRILIEQDLLNRATPPTKKEEPKPKSAFP